MKRKFQFGLEEEHKQKFTTIFKQLWHLFFDFLHVKGMIQVSLYSKRLYHIVWDEKQWSRLFDEDGMGWTLFLKSPHACSGVYDYLLTHCQTVDIPKTLNLSHLDCIVKLNRYTNLYNDTDEAILNRHCKTLTHLDLSFKNKTITESFQTLYPCLTDLYLDNSEIFNDKDIETLVVACPSLQSLTLRGCCNLSVKSLVALSKLQNLNDIIFGGALNLFSPHFLLHPLFKKLEKLGISSTGTVEQSKAFFDSFNSNNFAQLQELTLWGFTLNFYALSSLRPNALYTLIDLRIRKPNDGDWPDTQIYCFEKDFSEAAFASLLQCAPNLRYLEFDDWIPKTQWTTKTTKLLETRGKPFHLRLTSVRRVVYELGLKWGKCFLTSFINQKDVESSQYYKRFHRYEYFLTNIHIKYL